MSPVALFFLAALAAVFGLLMLLFILRRRDQLRMSQNPRIVSGTVTDVRTRRSKAGVSDCVRISYRIDGKEYTHVYFSRPDKFRKDETVPMICHPEKPNLAVPEVLFRVIPKSHIRLLAAFLVLLYLMTVCIVLRDTYDTCSTVMDCAKYPLMIAGCWISYWDVSRILRRGKSCTGTIVWTERDHRSVRVIAEFDADGTACETRMMQLPVKRMQREYHPGGQIGVLYLEENPAEAVIDDDAVKEKVRRLLPAAVISSIVLFGIMAAVWILPQ
ncbi:MAG: DUF3592 domain-containing protein [Oscillospiraceae bacterium]|nr:DUF3592 domain-containing protein [Oscillospiraceae bacterium]